MSATNELQAALYNELTTNPDILALEQVHSSPSRNGMSGSG